MRITSQITASSLLLFLICMVSGCGKESGSGGVGGSQMNPLPVDGEPILDTVDPNTVYFKILTHFNNGYPPNSALADVKLSVYDVDTGNMIASGMTGKDGIDLFTRSRFNTTLMIGHTYFVSGAVYNRDGIQNMYGFTYFIYQGAFVYRPIHMLPM